MPTQYSDLSHTLFPQTVDDADAHALMTDIVADSTILTAAAQYSDAVGRGDAARAESLLRQYPRLSNSIFNAEKYNWMRDAILATQRYYLHDVSDMVKSIAAHTVGFDDDNSEDSPSTNGYTISKILSLIKGTNVPVDSTAPSGQQSVLRPGVWSGSMPHTYQITIPGIKSDDNIDVSLDPSATAEQGKAWSKAMVLCASQSDNSITLRAYGKITADVNIPIVITVHN